ncbi:protein of unknown function [Pseudomonas sp. JV551A1]|uniref:Uncharacterized protein n=1 Tax=Pseudomonas inefficax TaxID=2078786 RepID=A0AAQ1P5J0_9PSED|nr:protein of unknown function [Pseudomonas sp. JV551A1]SPO58916.1 protein of unknown function [Pseudomonas inefficax]
MTHRLFYKGWLAVRASHLAPAYQTLQDVSVLNRHDSYFSHSRTRSKLTPFSVNQESG